MPHFHHNIDMVVPGSAADNARVPVPSRIVMVNGRSVQTVYHDECVAMIATAPRPVRLVLHVAHQTYQAHKRQPESEKSAVSAKVKQLHGARGAYRCSKCGQKKFGHICPFATSESKTQNSIIGSTMEAESQCDLQVTGNHVTQIDRDNVSSVHCDDSTPTSALLPCTATEVKPASLHVKDLPPAMPLERLPQLALPDECHFSLISKLQQAVNNGQGGMLVQQMVKTAQREQELKHNQHQATIGRVSLQQQQLIHTAFSGGTHARLS